MLESIFSEPFVPMRVCHYRNRFIISYPKKSFKFEIMKRILVLALSLTAICSYAQKVQPEEIPWMVVRYESPEWYTRQAEAWEEVVAREPQNENAWYNLSKAIKYADMDKEDGYARRQALYERMSKAIPDSYIYHFCAQDNYNDSISNAHMERAYQLMPQGRIFGEEYGSFIAYFWKNNREKELKEVAKLYYKEQRVPSDLLRYNYNELQCLSPNAIYFGNGDAILLPKIALQYGMGVHQDKMVITSAVCKVSSSACWGTIGSWQLISLRNFLSISGRHANDTTVLRT